MIAGDRSVNTMEKINPPDAVGDVAPKKRRVLLIEDQRTQRAILRAALERDGFEVEEAEDGIKGLQAFDRMRPDIVLLDVRMPMMDGFAVCEALRRQPGGDQLPILILTMLNDIESINRAYEVGATDFITKPVAWPVLGHRLRYMLRAGDAFQTLAKSEAELARRVAERTADLETANLKLEAANRGLEDFAHSVSHDLRAPLRAINGFASLLSANEMTALSPNGQELLRRVIANTTRMAQLISDMLEFSRVTRATLRRTKVDLHSLAKQVAEEMRDTHPAAEVEIGPLSVVTGDQAMLRQALANLIGNALKYSARTDKPRIEIGSTSSVGGTVYFVRDNGAGFDMTYAGDLFKLFRRMHTESEFPGTGVGLVIVKNIIERHGGKVWAESTVGQGATFYFTLGNTT